MDDLRLDSVSRLIAQGASRRAVLRGMFAGGLTVFTAGALSASAKQEKITVCKPTGAGYRLVEINAKQYEKRLEMGYFDPFNCDDGPSCEECQGTCVEYMEPCSSDADCCNERCLASSSTCGGTCYCYVRYNEAERLEFGELCLAGSGWTCGVECSSSAECDSGDVCIYPDASDPTCSSTGVCATTFYGPCDS